MSAFDLKAAEAYLDEYAAGRDEGMEYENEARFARVFYDSLIDACTRIRELVSNQDELLYRIWEMKGRLGQYEAQYAHDHNLYKASVFGKLKAQFEQVTVERDKARTESEDYWRGSVLWKKRAEKAEARIARLEREFAIQGFCLKCFRYVNAPDCDCPREEQEPAPSEASPKKGPPDI